MSSCIIIFPGPRCTIFYDLVFVQKKMTFELWPACWEGCEIGRSRYCVHILDIYRLWKPQKKFLFLVVRPLRHGGGVRAWPLKKYFFFAASLIYDISFGLYNVWCLNIRSFGHWPHFQDLKKNATPWLVCNFGTIILPYHIWPAILYLARAHDSKCLNEVYKAYVINNTSYIKSS